MAPASTNSFTSLLTLYIPADHQVLLYLAAMNWTEARDVCHGLLGRLYLPSSEADLQYHYDEIGGKYWTGK